MKKAMFQTFAAVLTTAVFATHAQAERLQGEYPIVQCQSLTDDISFDLIGTADGSERVEIGLYGERILLEANVMGVPAPGIDAEIFVLGSTPDGSTVALIGSDLFQDSEISPLKNVFFTMERLIDGEKVTDETRMNCAVLSL